MSQEITLMRALSKLKILEKRIQEFFEIQEPTFISFKREVDNLVSGTALGENDFLERSKSSWNKINDLITLHRNLKKKISEANNKYKVNILGTEMTISEAIYYKQTNEYKLQLLKKLSREINNYKQASENATNNIERSAHSMANQLTNKADSGSKSFEEAYNEFKNTLSKGMAIKPMDPLSAVKKCEELKSEIEEFNGELDFVLNEANSKYSIDLEGINDII